MIITHYIQTNWKIVLQKIIEITLIYFDDVDNSIRYRYYRKY